MIYRFIILVVIAAFLMLSEACNKIASDPQPDLLALQLKALQNKSTSWSIAGGSVNKDGYDVSDQFNGFTLTFGEFTYITKNSLASAWPSSGTWQFSNNDPNVILRDDGILMDLSLNSDRLLLRFSVDNTVGGRIEGLAGAFTFELSGN